MVQTGFSGLGGRCRWAPGYQRRYSGAHRARAGGAEAADAGAAEAADAGAAEAADAGAAEAADAGAADVALVWENEMARERVIMSSGHSESVPVPHAVDEVPVEELARRQGVRPVESVDDMARPGLFGSDAEWEEFLADLYASRRPGLA